jgi:hypothetical protein
MRSRLRALTLTTALWAIPSAVSSQNLVALASTASGLQLASLGIGTGVATLIGAGPIPGGSISMSGGISAYDETANVFYFVGTPSSPPGSSATLYAVSAATGSVANSAALSGSAVNGVLGLHYDAGEGVLYGVASVGAGDRQIITISIAAGTFGQVTLLGSGVGGGGAVSTSGATEDLDAVGNRYFFIGDPGTGARLYAVSTVSPTFTITSAALSGDSTSILGLEFDDGGTLYGLASVSGDRRLVVIVPSGGTMGQVSFAPGSANIAGESLGTSGPEASDPSGNRYFFTGTPDGGSLSLYQLNMATGATSDVDAITGTGVLGISAIQYDAGPLPVELERFEVD